MAFNESIEVSICVVCFYMKATNFPSDQTISFYTCSNRNKTHCELYLKCDTCTYFKSNADFTIYF
jgi:hypothetical protein